jgi:ankyrin repeat protein
VENNSINDIKHLIEYGANVNHQNKDGNTPLILVCDKGLFTSIQYTLQDIRSIIAILLDAGADINIKNNRNKTAFDVLDVSYGSNENKKRH